MPDTETDAAPFKINYSDVRESLALILATETDPQTILNSLDDAVSNNLGD